MSSTVEGTFASINHGAIKCSRRVIIGVRSAKDQTQAEAAKKSFVYECAPMPLLPSIITTTTTTITFIHMCNQCHRENKKSLNYVDSVFTRYFMIVINSEATDALKKEENMGSRKHKHNHVEVLERQEMH